jgi:hypothetical protein
MHRLGLHFGDAFEQPVSCLGRGILLAIVGFVVPALVAKSGRAGLARIHEAILHRPAPRNPASRKVGWREAVIWSIAAGATTGLLRLIVRRVLAEKPALKRHVR